LNEWNDPYFQITICIIIYLVNKAVASTKNKHRQTTNDRLMNSTLGQKQRDSALFSMNYGRPKLTEHTDWRHWPLVKWRLVLYVIQHCMVYIFFLENDSFMFCCPQWWRFSQLSQNVKYIVFGVHVLSFPLT